MPKNMLCEGQFCGPRRDRFEFASLFGRMNGQKSYMVNRWSNSNGFTSSFGGVLSNLMVFFGEYEFSLASHGKQDEDKPRSAIVEIASRRRVKYHC
jgi:hypothetical protein